MRSRVRASEKSPGNDRETARLVNNSLPPEIWGRIADLLPMDDIYCLAMSVLGLKILSIFAWHFCLQRLNFVKLDSQQQLSVLRKLYFMQVDAHLEKFKSLLRLRKEPLEIKPKRLLLEEAICRKDEDLASLSIFHRKDEEDLAAGLILSVKHQQSSMIEFFLALGAGVDVDWVDGEPISSLRIACDRGDIRLINLLLEYDHLFGRTILHVAASFGCYDIVDHLQQSQRFEILKEVKDKFGRLPMHYAVFAANLRMVRLLSSLGCSINIRDEEGYNLMHIVVTRRMAQTQREEAYKSLLEWLMAEGCDPNALNNDGETPLECAKNQVAPQWAVDILQTHAIESMDSNTHEAALEANVGLNPQYPIDISSDEETDGP